jgi:hypothetical protein
MGLVALLYAESVLLVEQKPVRLAKLPFPPLGACALQLVEDRLVDPTQSAFREEDLVRAGECALEPHRRGIILAPGQGKLCPVDAPRPKGACFLGEDRDTSMEQGPERRVTLVGGWISCAVGALPAAGMVYAALSGGGANITAGVLGMGFGILGYFLGPRWPATSTVFLCAAAIVFGLAANQGYVS